MQQCSSERGWDEEVARDKDPHPHSTYQQDDTIVEQASIIVETTLGGEERLTLAVATGDKQERECHTFHIAHKHYQRSPHPGVQVSPTCVNTCVGGNVYHLHAPSSKLTHFIQ